MIYDKVAGVTAFGIEEFLGIIQANLARENLKFSNRRQCADMRRECRANRPVKIGADNWS